MPFPFLKQPVREQLYTVAFYNLENLFDTSDDPRKLDDDFTLQGIKKWTPGRYDNKIDKLARTIVGMGRRTSKKSPVLLGIAEVENKRVIEDLLDAKPLKSGGYSCIHYDSPDERGIDTALIYQKAYFEILFSEPIALMVNNPDGERDTTRDILYVYGKLNGAETHVFVNHWPSRREGGTETAYKRLAAVQTMVEYMAGLESRFRKPYYIIMGDFNDGPGAASIQLLVKTKALFNPMEKLLTPERGSANYRQSWTLFDQIMISNNFLGYQKGTHSFANANIFDEYFLTEYKGRYAGFPFRTFGGRKYLGGYSDHFPVYIQLKYDT